MNMNLLDLYSDYLLSSLSATTATGLSALMSGDVSHDQVTRLLSGDKLDGKTWWKIIKPHIRSIQQNSGVVSVDDSIVEKPYTDENDLICWHYDHSKGRTIKGINFITALYEVEGVTLPATFRLVTKTEKYIDKNGKEKRRSSITKNEHFRAMIKQLVQNQIPFSYVLMDIWFAAAENFRFLKLTLKKDFVAALKSNRKVALSLDDKNNGQYTRIDTLELPANTPIQIYLEGVPFALLLMRQCFTNEDGSIGERYLVTSDLTLDADSIATLYKRRWKVEEYHRSLKQNASVAKSPTRTETTQTNHFVASLWAYTKLELLKVRTKRNHYALKSQLYLRALQQAFEALQELKPVTLAHLSA